MGYDWFMILTVIIYECTGDSISKLLDDDGKTELLTSCLDLSEKYKYEYGSYFGCVHHTRNGMVTEEEFNIAVQIVKELLNTFPDYVFEIFKFEFDGETRIKYIFKMDNGEFYMDSEKFIIKIPNNIKLHCNIDSFSFEGDLSAQFNSDYEGYFDIFQSTREEFNYMTDRKEESSEIHLKDTFDIKEDNNDHTNQSMFNSMSSKSNAQSQRPVPFPQQPMNLSQRPVPFPQQPMNLSQSQRPVPFPQQSMNLSQLKKSVSFPQSQQSSNKNYDQMSNEQGFFQQSQLKPKQFDINDITEPSSRMPQSQQSFGMPSQSQQSFGVPQQFQQFGSYQGIPSQSQFGSYSGVPVGILQQPFNSSSSLKSLPTEDRKLKIPEIKKTLSHNSSNPYTDYDNQFRCQVYEIPDIERHAYIEAYEQRLALIKRDFSKFEYIEDDPEADDEAEFIISEMSEMSEEFMFYWKSTLKTLHPQYCDEIDEITNFWDDCEHENSELYMNDGESIYINTILYEKKYTLIDIYAYPGDNQHGVIFLKYNESLYPIFINCDSKLSTVDINIVDSKIERLILKLKCEILGLEKFRQYSNLEELNKINDFKRFFVYSSGRSRDILKTTLMESVELGLTEVVNFLLNHGANPYIKNSNGESAYDIAKRIGFHWPK